MWKKVQQGKRHRPFGLHVKKWEPKKTNSPLKYWDKIKSMKLIWLFGLTNQVLI